MNYLKKLWLFLRSLLIAILLTVVTQVGGIVYLLAKPLGLFIKSKKKGWTGFVHSMLMYFSIYMVISLFVVPSLALHYDRVPLPCFSSATFPIKPARHFYWIANRHYVRKELYDLTLEFSNNVNTKFQGTEIYYLDANFPLLKYFPLLPHKSHNDGRRLDICFLYTDQNEQPVNVAPGILGYGHCEIPKAGEVNMPERCSKKGHRLYSALYEITKHFRDHDLRFDKNRNTYLIKAITNQKRVRKVFIEPHLKSRLKLEGESKIRFHGCGAVRHDDHIHLEL